MQIIYIIYMYIILCTFQSSLVKLEINYILFKREFIHMINYALQFIQM